MQTQLEKAKHTLFDREGLHVSNVKMFPGSNREITAEQMSAQINNVVDRLTTDGYEDITDRDD